MRDLEVSIAEMGVNEGNDDEEKEEEKDEEVVEAAKVEAKPLGMLGCEAGEEEEEAEEVDSACVGVPSVGGEGGDRWADVIVGEVVAIVYSVCLLI